jgi:Domain of unknown function (DUF4265)
MSHEKVKFTLTQDDDGYPPVGSEGLWAIPLPNGNLLLDNIPFYASQVSLGDEIAAVLRAPREWQFDRVVAPSGNSTFRIMVTDLNQTQDIRREFDNLGCRTEVDATMGLIAVNVAKGADIHPVLDELMRGKGSGVFDFEEAALRHEI